jgi:tetratricopeptide (TPR) repeat protein
MISDADACCDVGTERSRAAQSCPPPTQEEPMTTRRSTIAIATALALAMTPLAVAQHGLDQDRGADAAPPMYAGLGEHGMRITTSSEDAQRYFDQGLALVYGFDHFEAARSFREAIRLDPGCAMCHWGLALALGPHINAGMPPDAVAPAFEAITAAHDLAASATERERAYVAALATRYASDPAADRGALDRAYADAMRELTHSYPDDLDAATLFAEALMNLMPWAYWSEDGSPQTATVELLEVLEGVLARDPYHPGANQHYIHAVEASDQPGRAEGAADRLVELGVQVGHMLHMPSHIYARVGRWHDASIANEIAVEADRAYLAAVAAEGLVPVLYHPHNLHFLAWTAGMEGRSAVALRAGQELVEATPVDLAHDLLFLNSFLTMPVQTMVRFGAWSDILDGGPRAGAHPFEVATWHFARGRALVAVGDLDGARAEAQSLASSVQGPEAEAMEQPQAFFPGASMLRIAQDVLDGHIAAAGGDVDAAVAALERAVEGHDALPYFEPPHWFVSPRIDLGWILLRAGRASDAEAVFRADLDVYAENGWALAGLAESLTAQGAEAEAAEVEARLEAAWRLADVPATIAARAE